MLVRDASLESLLTTPCRDIAILLNTDGIYVAPPCGFNDLESQFYAAPGIESFAGFLCRNKVLPELADIGPKELGKVIVIKKNDHTYHGIVCYKLGNKNGAEDNSMIKSCLDKIQTCNTLAFSLQERLWKKSSLPNILKVIKESNLPIVLYR